MSLSKHCRPFIILSVGVLLILGMTKAYYDTNSLEVRHFEVTNSSLAEVLSGLKVAHLSDLHIKKNGLMGSKVLETLKKEKPDLIYITGDFISFEGPYEPVISFLHQLKASYRIYGVLGNTEYSNENGSCILCHKEKSKTLKEKENPIILRNSFLPLKINGKTLNIFGVDDPVDKKSNFKKALKGADLAIPSILLAHSPEIFEEASSLGIDLILCGHTHGGQIFLAKYLRKILPLDQTLEFLDGFFQKGTTLMYVSQGIGTSFLPFRFGIKPEITFFTFSNNTNNEKIRMARIGKIEEVDQTNRKNSVSISNVQAYTLFLGFRISSLLETFSLMGVVRNPFVSGNSNSLSTLFDFESETELKRLNWECHKWFELSKEHVTSGEYSLKVTLPPGQYPGILFEEIRNDWSDFNYLVMDVFNPSDQGINFHIRIDDNKSGWEYANRFDIDFKLKPGMNHISIPTDSIKTNLHHRPLNLKQIKQMMVFLTNNTKQRELYFDNIRLE